MRTASVERQSLPQVPSPVANENFILRNGSKSALASYWAENQTFRRVDKGTAYGIQPRNAEQSFALTALLNDDVKLVTLAGKAGTGKTLLALAGGAGKPFASTARSCWRVRSSL